MKMNIAIVWGGYSSEKEVSERSAAGIYKFIDKERFNVYKVKISRDTWLAESNGNYYQINKNDFSFECNNSIIKFDFAYVTIHGTPGEDGVLQGYFDMLCIPYSNSGVLSSALTFNKFTCNNFLKSFGVNVAPSLVLRKDAPYNTPEIIKMLGLPVFVKPNVGGSSFATTKVKLPEQLDDAINDAFSEVSEVIIERFISGIEVTCGCFKLEKGIVMLPLTEVVPKNEFFDYDAKYNGEVDEITPARISKELTELIQKETARIYDLVNAKGIIRADYIIMEGTPVLLEVNTTPGMTETSFIPQQVAAANLSMTEVLSNIIEFEYSKFNR